MPNEFCSDPGWDRHQAHTIVSYYATASLLAELTQNQDAAAALSAGSPTIAGESHRQHGYEATGPQAPISADTNERERP